MRVPALRLRAAPRRHVVHEEPPVVGSARDEGVHLVEGVAIVTHQHFAPHAFHARDSQRHVDAVQRHPVELLLPAFPAPEGHRVAVGAEIEVVAPVDAGGVRLGVAGG